MLRRQKIFSVIYPIPRARALARAHTHAHTHTPIPCTGRPRRTQSKSGGAALRRRTSSFLFSAFLFSRPLICARRWFYRWISIALHSFERVCIGFEAEGGQQPRSRGCRARARQFRRSCSLCSPGEIAGASARKRAREEAAGGKKRAVLRLRYPPSFLTPRVYGARTRTTD